MKSDKTKKSIKYSNLEGSFGNAMVGFSENYINPYALAMKASNQQIGLLSAISNLLASLFQLKSADILDKVRSRKIVVLFSVFLQALMFIPIILIPFLFKENLNRVYALIIFFSLYAALGSFGAGAYGSWISSLINGIGSGKFFGYRAKIFGAIAITTMFIAGYILSLFNGISQGALTGFIVIFFLAMLCRFVSFYFIKKMHEPTLNFRKDDKFGFIAFYKRLKESNFAKFTLYIALVVFTTNIAGPFFSVYVLRDLKFSYLMYTLWIVSVSITSLITSTYWGKRIDNFGNIKILKITSIMVPIIPLLYLISKEFYWLIFIQLFSGVIWAGFNLSAGNFVFDAAIPEKRARCIAYFNVGNGVAVFFGAILGGFLIKYLPVVLGSNLLTLFLISGILRGVVAIIMLPMIKEVRRVRKFGISGLYPLNNIREIDGVFKEFFRYRKK